MGGKTIRQSGLAQKIHLSVRKLFGAGVYIAGGAGLEKTELRLGFVPLSDSAPLVAAVEKGFFKRHGLDVTLSREPSWANIRDKVAVGALDGAHMLAAMPIAATLGLGGIATPMTTALVTSLNGNAVTVSNALFDEMLAADPEAMRDTPMTARALKAVIGARKARRQPPLTFATVFPFSGHNYELRYWMAQAGIDPDADVRLIVVPPPQMIANLSAQTIDGYCVGEPWNSIAVARGIGRILITSTEIWNGRPEKVLGVTRKFAESCPNTHRALIRALIETAKWLAKPVSRIEMAGILSDHAYTNAPAELILPSMTGRMVFGHGEPVRSLPDLLLFYRHAATFPWRSQALWFASQMVRWKQCDDLDAAKAAARETFQPDIYRAAAGELGIAAPMIDEKVEGLHATPWSLTQATRPISMSADTFFDGSVFDPAQINSYAAQFAKDGKETPGAEKPFIA